MSVCYKKQKQPLKQLGTSLCFLVKFPRDQKWIEDLNTRLSDQHVYDQWVLTKGFEPVTMTWECLQMNLNLMIYPSKIRTTTTLFFTRNTLSHIMIYLMYHPTNSVVYNMYHNIFFKNTLLIIVYGSICISRNKWTMRTNNASLVCLREKISNDCNISTQMRI